MITVYGINNCTTVKKALKWLRECGVEHTFHDFRKEGMDAERLTAWGRELGFETLLNRRGPTWRKIPEEEKSHLDSARAVALMMEYPTVVRRPVLDLGERRVVGFDETQYAELFHD